jgi:hypothetical protein
MEGVLGRRVSKGLAWCVFGSLAMLLAADAASAEIRVVNAGGNLQAALNAAVPGDEVVVAAGARFTGSFKLPAKPFGPAITVRSSATLPNRRLQATDAALLPTLASGTTSPALVVVNTANWRIDGVRFEANTDGIGTIIQVLDSTAIVFDRLLIIGGASGQKRAVQGNGRQITLTRSHIANIWKSGQDSQAFCAWDGAGPYTITNNYLEAASENIMFGGADSQTADRVPSDILIESNFLSKRLEWKGQARVVKNVFELKAARRVTVRNNVFERSWTDGQTGFGIAFTVRNQNGKATWSATQDVLFERNIVRDVERGISILGHDSNYPSAQTTRITIRNNLIITAAEFIQATAQVGEVTVDHNTVINGGTVLKMARGSRWVGGVKVPADYAIEKLLFTNNLSRHNLYGVFGEGAGIGVDALKIVGDWIFLNNVLAGGSSVYVYPPTTLRPSESQHAAQFESQTYALVASSPYRNAGTDGEDLGAPLPFSGTGGAPRGPTPPARVVIR